MSLRLLQKQLGQDASSATSGSARGRGWGRGGRGGGGGAGSWLGSRPKAAAGCKYAGKGKGRGGSAFFGGLPEEEEPGGPPSPAPAGEAEADGWAQPPAETTPEPSASSVPAASPPPEPDHDGVPGLDDVLRQARLEAKIGAAQAWCEEQGAANLEELVEFYEDFAKAIGLKPLEQKRLMRALPGGATEGSKAAGAAGQQRAPARAATTPKEGAKETEEEAAQLKRRDDAAKALSAAMDGDDIEALEGAIAVADEQGVSKEALAAARKRVAQLRRLKKAAKTLAAAVEQRDVDELEAAISLAEDEGVSQDSIESAREALSEAREQVAQARRREEAAEVLAAAAGGNDVEALEAAIRKAEAEGVDEESIEEAKEALSEAREEAAQARRREEAMEKLAEAAGSDDLEAIVAAIRHAEDEGVDEESIDEAREALAEARERASQAQRRDEATKALAVAAEDGTVAALEAAISLAQDEGVGEDAVDKAKEALSEARRRQKREDVARALNAAAAGDDVEALESAIAEAEDEGLDEEAIATSRKALTIAREKADQARRREEAAEKLADAAGEDDVETLEAAISMAEDAGVDEESIEEAREVLAAAREKAAQARRREEAAEKLADAAGGDDLAALEAAICEAEKEGVDEVSVEEAREALAEARERESQRQKRDEAAKALASAVGEDDVEALEAAIGVAEDADVDEEAIEDAREALLAARKKAAQLQRREEAAKALAAAMAEDDMETLEAAISLAEDHEVSSEVIQKAKEVLESAREKAAQLRRREEAAKALAAAAAEDSMDALERAIRLAEEIGVSEEALTSGRKRAAQLKEREAAAKALVTAIDSVDIKSLEVAISLAEEQGASEELITNAKKALEAAQKKAAELLKCEEALAVAAGGDDIEALEVAISRAEDEGISDDLIEEAKEALMELRKAAAARARRAAEMAEELQVARRQEDVEALRAAITRAESTPGMDAAVLTEASRALEELKRKIEARERAESELAVAQEGGDALALEEAIAQAEEAGVGPAALKEAKGFLGALQDAMQRKRTSMDTLANAVKAEDIVALGKAIAGAEAAGVDSATLSDAQATLHSLEEKARRDEAENAVAKAIENGHIDALSAALDHAASVGVDQKCLDDGRAQLRQLEEERRLAKLRQEAEAAIADATERGDIDALKQAIALAEGADVADGPLGEARKRLDVLELKAQQKADAERTLRRALEDPKVEVLRAAIQQADEAEVDGDILETARTKLEALEAEQQNLRDEAAAALAAATAGSDVATLEEAVARAHEVGIDDAGMIPARERLKELEAEVAQRQSAQGALAAAAGGDDADALRKAIVHAEQLGVDDDAMQDARARLGALEREAERRRLREEAEEALASALRDGTLSVLEDAVKRAAEVGVAEEAMNEQRELIARLQKEAAEKNAASDALTKAMGSNDIDGLVARIAEAEASRIDETLLDKAQKRLAALREEKKKASVKEATSALQAATKGSQVEGLKDAIARAEDSGVAPGILEKARKELAKKEAAAEKARVRAEAEKELQAAAEGTDLSTLQDAIARADKAGASKAAIGEAKRTLTALQEAQRRRAEAEAVLKEALAGSSAEALQKAIATAEAAGAPASDLEAASARLAELEAAEARRRELDAALEQMRTAMTKKDVAVLRTAIEQATSLGADAKATEAAKKALDKLIEKAEKDEATAQLQALTDTGDIATLKAELERAEKIGVAKKAIDKARKKVAEMEKEEAARRRAEEEAEEERKREEQRSIELAEATTALTATMETSDIGQLEKAIARAVAAGADDASLELARKALAELQEQERKMLEQKEAVDVVLEDLRAEDWASLNDSLAEAEALGVPAEELADARRQLAAHEEEAARKSEAYAAEAIAELRAAEATRDAVALSTAIERAEEAGVDQQEIASAKRAVFQLQKEKREQTKKDKERKDALNALEAAAEAQDIEAMRESIARAEKAGCDEADLVDARELVASIEADQSQEAAKLALDDLAYAISQDDVESATLALEEAIALDANPEDIAAGEKAIADLREKLDPEGEARRRRIEARKQKEGVKKWNFAGKSKNQPVNDRFREHEAELEQRRMLAFRGRGRFKGNAEDEGEDAAEKEVKKQRAEVIKEKGAVPVAPKPQKGFTWGRSPAEESEAPRQLTLRAHREMGAGIDLHASWWGMFVDSIDDEPGQPGLRVKDTITDVNGTTLRELESEDCEQRFADLFGDGSVVTVEPYVELVGFLQTASGKLDKTSLQDDLERFAADWGVELSIQEAGTGVSNIRVVLEGSQAAVQASKPELEKLMVFYAAA